MFVIFYEFIDFTTLATTELEINLYNCLYYAICIVIFMNLYVKFKQLLQPHYKKDRLQFEFMPFY